MAASPWSSTGIDKMNTNITGVDDKLKMVSDELQNQFMLAQGVFIGQKDLSTINAEYKRAYADQHSVGVSNTTFGVVMAFAVTIVILAFIAKSLSKGYLYASFVMVVVPLILLLAFFFWKLNRAQKMQEAAGELVKQHFPILNSFCEAVEAVQYLGRTITEESIREHLVTLAVRILDAEAKLDVVRLAHGRLVHDLNHLSGYILKTQESMDRVSAGAEKFGLKFSKSRLFLDGAKHINDVAARIAQANMTH